METEKLLLILLTVTLTVSGCSNLEGALPGGNSDNTNSEPEQLPGRGLEVNSFSITDETMSPGQTAEVTLELQNYHREGVELEEINLYNTGLLTAEKERCTPDEENLEAATTEVNPVMECTWTIEAPSSNEMGGFSQRSASFYANIPYETSIENYQPLEVEFRNLGDINSTSEKSISFTNGEVDVQASVETPVAYGEQKAISFNLQRAGDGRVDENYTFSYEPSEVFDLDGDGNIDGEGAECPEEDQAILGGGLEFGCSISMEGSTPEVRNVFFTASYKYVKSPTMSITIVNE